jgi:hypothetical protein
MMRLPVSKAAALPCSSFVGICCGKNIREGAGVLMLEGEYVGEGNADGIELGDMLASAGDIGLQDVVTNAVRLTISRRRATVINQVLN